jgi:hypothetical protein
MSFISLNCSFFIMTRIAIPPGISFIFSQLPSVLVPIGGTYAVLSFARGYFTLRYPLWISIMATFALQPVILFIRSGLSTLARGRKVVSMGAVMPPHVPENSFQVVKSIVSSFQDGYIGCAFQN